MWKNGPIDFKKYFKINFSFSYCSHQCHVIHNKFPSDIGNHTVTVTVNSVIITELIRSQISMAVIFLMAEFWGFAPTFCHTRLKLE
jgi:poly(A) polymerase Pap1